MWRVENDEGKRLIWKWHCRKIGQHVRFYYERLSAFCLGRSPVLFPLTLSNVHEHCPRIGRIEPKTSASATSIENRRQQMFFHANRFQVSSENWAGVVLMRPSRRAQRVSATTRSTLPGWRRQRSRHLPPSLTMPA